jgi:hypothetical protein
VGIESREIIFVHKPSEGMGVRNSEKPLKNIGGSAIFDYFLTFLRIEEKKYRYT